jgi:hypothetical protein
VASAERPNVPVHALITLEPQAKATVVPMRRVSQKYMQMTKTRWKALILLLMCGGISLIWGSSLHRDAPSNMVDFKAVYYGARCVIQKCDPYDESAFLRAYEADGGKFPSDARLAIQFRQALPFCINLPTSLFLISPFTMLPWGPAHLLWIGLMFACLMLAVFLAWDLASATAPSLALLLTCFMIANSEVLFALGNLAGCAISLCVIAVWCLLKQRFIFFGTLCLGLSLVIKPHDVGFVWLYFLLTGTASRKQARHSAAIAIALGLAALAWVSHVAPHWIHELQANLVTTSKHGGLNDPGVASMTGRTVGMVISLQSFFSVLRDDPHFYNPMSYLVSGALLLLWAIKTVRTRFTQEGAWLALAAVSALSLLPVYHRPYDAKLLLLAIPACAMLWAEGGMRRWLAIGLTSAGILFTSDIPLAILVTLTQNLHFSTANLTGKLMTILLLRPTSIILLAMGCFYLWVYVRYDPGQTTAVEHGDVAERPIESATT